MSTPIEAQECANCHYARKENKFRPDVVGKSVIHCHYHAPQRSQSGTLYTAIPVRPDAWCGQWSLHPSFAELAHG
jgi:hypothetical protein